MIRTLCICFAALLSVLPGFGQVIDCQPGAQQIDYTDPEGLEYLFNPIIEVVQTGGEELVGIVLAISPVSFPMPNRGINMCVFGTCLPAHVGEFQYEETYPPVPVVDTLTKIQISPHVWVWDEFLGDSTWMARPISGDYVFDLTIYPSANPSNSFTFRYTLHDATQASAVERPVEVPRSITLSVYPNPFNSTTRLRFGLLEPGAVSVMAFDILGREVAEILDEPYLAAGEHEITWNAQGTSGIALPTGTYIVTVRTNQLAVSRPLVLMR